MIIGFHRHNGAGSRDGYCLAYKTFFGMQVLRDETGKPVVFSKVETHAANYGKKNEVQRVNAAMHSRCWPSGVLIDFSGQ